MVSVSSEMELHRKNGLSFVSSFVVRSVGPNDINFFIEKRLVRAWGTFSFEIVLSATERVQTLLGLKDSKV